MYTGPSFDFGNSRSSLFMITISREFRLQEKDDYFNFLRVTSGSFDYLLSIPENSNFFPSSILFVALYISHLNSHYLDLHNSIEIQALVGGFTVIASSGLQKWIS